MLTTVTATTIAAVTVFSEDPELGGMAVVGLLLMLALREIASAAEPRWRELAANLVVAVLPLLFVLAFIVVRRLLDFHLA